MELKINVDVATPPLVTEATAYTVRCGDSAVKVNQIEPGYYHNWQVEGVDAFYSSEDEALAVARGWAKKNEEYRIISHAVARELSKKGKS